MNFLKAIIPSLFIVCQSFSQNADRIFQGLQEKDHYLEVTVNDGFYRFQFYNSKILETSFVPNGEHFNEVSHAVVLKPSRVETQLKESDTAVDYSSNIMALHISKKPFQVFYYYQGKPVISEKSGYRKTDSLETIQFNLTKDEVLYGGGARALDMKRRGYRLQLYNRAHYGYETHSELMNFTLPIVLSSKRYMIHFDNAPIGFLDLDSQHNNTMAYETISGRKTYQVIVGDSWMDLIDNYTQLTGKQPMPPRWALGNFSSRFGYHSQKEAEATIAKFKKENIPVDAIIFDLYWFGKDVKGTMGNLKVFKDSFPDFKNMVAHFKDQGVKTVLITEPFMLTTSNRWQEAVDKDILAKDTIGNPATYDFFFGHTGLIDVYNPKAQNWFWDIYKSLANKGVAGFWGDLGEPEVHPSWLRHVTGTADEVHNSYGMDWAKLIFDGYQQDFSTVRPFILMRAGYSGSQRYGLIPWSGDVNRTWGGLQSQPEIALQMGMQGLAYMHSDLGGFAGANLDDNLYTRWLQYGVFQPIFRPHAQEEVPSEPVFRSERAKMLAKVAIQLRYKLLPYNYNLAFQNHKTGAPLMRPLFTEEPDNTSLYTNASEYLWGPDFLVAPIVKDSIDRKKVYFPKTSKWFDFYTDDLFEGGQIKTVETNENAIPTYVRAGAFILMAKPMQNTEEYTAGNFELHYYNDASITQSERWFYNDDGITPKAFEMGRFEMLGFKFESKPRKVKVELEPQLGSNYSTSSKHIDVVLHHIKNQPKRVKVAHKKVSFQWDSKGKTLKFPVLWNTNKTLDIKIKFKEKQDGQ